jgi:hypothetical protein
MKFDNLKINYTTNQVPPPYAHEYSLNIAFNGKNLEVGFELNYIHRDDISQEEIAAEGFSENDDFKEWKLEYSLDKGHQRSVKRNRLEF